MLSTTCNFHSCKTLNRVDIKQNCYHGRQIASSSCLAESSLNFKRFRCAKTKMGVAVSGSHSNVEIFNSLNIFKINKYIHKERKKEI